MVWPQERPVQLQRNAVSHTPTDLAVAMDWCGGVRDSKGMPPYSKDSNRHGHLMSGRQLASSAFEDHRLLGATPRGSNKAATDTGTYYRVANATVNVADNLSHLPISTRPHPKTSGVCHLVNCSMIMEGKHAQGNNGSTNPGKEPC